MTKKIDWSNARGGIPAGMIMIKGELVDAKKARRQAQLQNLKQNFVRDTAYAVKRGIGTAAKSVRGAVKNSNLSKTITKLKGK